MSPAGKSPSHFCFVVEGLLDEVALRRLLRPFPSLDRNIIATQGKSNLIKSIPGYARSSHISWIFILDLDQAAPCAPAYRDDLHKQHPLLKATDRCLHIAVRALEAWLLADREAMRKFLGCALSKIPCDPEQCSNPKETLLQIAGKSKKAKVLIDPESSGTPKPATTYTATLGNYIINHWEPERACQNSPSLERLMRHIRSL